MTQSARFFLISRFIDHLLFVSDFRQLSCRNFLQFSHSVSTAAFAPGIFIASGTRITLFYETNKEIDCWRCCHCGQWSRVSNGGCWSHILNDGSGRHMCICDRGCGHHVLHTGEGCTYTTTTGGASKTSAVPNLGGVDSAEEAL